MNDEKLHPIGYAARATGLSPHVIRIWEKRYGAVTPGRSHKNRRLYSAADIARLSLLKKATTLGYGISRAARLEPTVLSEIGQEAVGDIGGKRWDTPYPEGPAPHVEASWQAIEQLDAPGLTAALDRAEASLGRSALAIQVISPICGRIGKGWTAGSLRIAQEHMASAIIEGVLSRLLASAGADSHAPRMVVATPVGQWCRLGALMAAVLSADLGWRVLYLGANLPADEIAAAAVAERAEAVGLGIACRSGSLALERELVRLRKGVGGGAVLFAGGQGGATHRVALEAAGARWYASLEELITDPPALR